MNRTTPALHPRDLSLLLAQLVVGRLCDDVRSLLAGARANLSLAAEAPPAIDGVDALSRRLALLKASWGPNTPRLTARTITSLAEGLPSAHRLRLDLSGLPRQIALSPVMGRVVLNALILASESLPRGGVIWVSAQEGGRILVGISGTHAGWPREFSHLVNRPDAAPPALSNSKRLLSPLVVLIALDAGIRLSFHAPPRPTPPAIPALLLSPT